MCKKKNYFIVMYDKYDNYIRDFDSIEQCSKFFNTTNNNISCYICQKKLKDNKYRLFKIIDNPNIN